MMPKISFSKLHIEDGRHRILVIILAFFAFFMEDIFYFINLQNATANVQTPAELETALQVAVKELTAPNAYSFGIIFILASIMAVQAFRFLHNRARVDFHFSMPISRKEMYRLILGNDILIFLLPFLLFHLIQIGITAGYGMINHAYWIYFLRGLISDLLCFLMFYLLMTLSILLTGQTIVSILAYLTFLSYAPAILRTVVNGYSKIFFKTYYVGGGETGFVHVLNHLSPFSLGYMMTETSTASYYIISAIWCVLLLVVTYVIFKKRPTESAGNALSFRRGQKLLKAMITLPMAMITGLFFELMTINSNIIWLYFGVILGAIIFHGIVEAIILSDIRGLWSEKKELFVMIVCSLLATLCFDVDVIKYDAYRADSSDIQAVIVRPTVYYYNDVDISHALGSTLSSGRITGEAKDQIIEMLNTELDATFSEDLENYTVVDLCYIRQNGRKIFRSYRITGETNQALKEQLYTSEAYKKQIYDILSYSNNMIDKIQVVHPYAKEVHKLTSEEVKELFDIYQKDLLQITYDDVYHSHPVCQLEIILDDSVKGYSTLETYCVYPSFTDTVDYLKSKGFFVADSAKDLSVSALWFKDNLSEDGNQEYKITDPEIINTLKDKLYFEGLVDPSIDFAKENMQISAEIDNVIIPFITDEDTESLLCKLHQ